MTVVAIHLKTESGDDYLFMNEYDKIIDIVKRSLGEELGCVCQWTIATYPWNVDVSSYIRNHLQFAIEEEQQ